MKTPWVLLILLFCYSINIISQEKSFNSTQIIKSNDMSKKTTEEWKKILNNEEYKVLIEKGTEHPHTGNIICILKMAYITEMGVKILYLIVIKSLKLIL